MPARNLALPVLPQPQHQRLWHRQGHGRRNAGSSGDLQFAGARAQRGFSGQQCRTGHAHRPTDHQHAPPLLLVAARRWQRHRTQRGSGQRAKACGSHQRAPAGRSDSVVTGSSASSGGTNLVRTSCSDCPSAAAAYSVTPQFGTSPSRSMARMVASSIRSIR